MRLLTATGLVLSLNLLASAQTTNGTDPTTPPDNAICTTQACNTTATEILANMNPSADPCQDFYEFTCGGFMQSKTIPPGESGVTAWQYEHTANVTRSILEADPKTLKGMNGEALDETSLRNLDKIQGLYKSCMNESQLEAAGVEPLLAELQNLVTDLFPVPGSPLTRLFSNGTGGGGGDGGNETTTTSPPGGTNATQPPPGSGGSGVDREQLSSTLAQFVLTGVEALVSLAVTEDALAPTEQTLLVSETGLTLPTRELYKEPTVLQAFQGVVQEVFGLVLGGRSADNATVNQLAQDVVTVESQLANISSSVGEQRDILKMWNAMPVSGLEDLNGAAVDWMQLLSEMFGAYNISNPYAPSGNTDGKNVTVMTPTYQQKLGQWLQQNSTTPAMLQSYFAWKVIKARHHRLAEAYRRPMDRMSALLSGTDPNEVPQRWKTCLGQTNRYLGPLLGYFYVAQEFTAEDKTTMIDMIETLKRVYKADFPQTTWLDNQTRANAMEKLEAIESLVGYSMAEPNVGDPQDLARYFAEVDVAPAKGGFYEAMDEAGRQPVRKNLERINGKTVREWMFVDPQTINAFYYPTTNQVIFPAAFMQKPLYTAGNPDYLNYGAIGFIAAHEITHGFDSSGRHFDGTGKIHNWWSNETEAEFQTRSQCFVDQYSNFTITNPTTNQTSAVDGQLTLGENIADNGGLKKAYEAWYQRFKGTLPDNGNGTSGSSAGGTAAAAAPQNPILPGLEKYTRDQMFFISYGQVWCTKLTPELDQQLLLIDTHAPARWRVNGPVQNTPAFSQAFKCAQGAPMNPAKKCAVW